MNKVCIDASLAVAWLSWSQLSEQANELLRQWARDGFEILVPPVFHAEVLSALAREVTSSRMLPEEADEAFGMCLDMPVRTVDGPELYRIAWATARQLRLPTCYDSLYLAAAKLNECEFWTADKKLADFVKTSLDGVKWLGDYGEKARNPTEEPARPEPPPRDVPRFDAPRLDDPGLWRAFS